MGKAAGHAKDKRFHIEVSRDHFTAYLHVAPNIKEGEIDISDIKRALLDQKIVYGVKEDEKLRVFLENLELYGHTLIVASGVPFTHGRDAEIKFNFNTDARYVPREEIKPAHSIDFREVGNIQGALKDSVIATKYPAAQGTPGITVYGQKLPGEWGMDITLNAGKNVSLAPNKTDYIAEVSGAPLISKNTLRVDDVFIVDGDVDFEVGNINFEGTVVIKGSVLDGFTVRAGGDVIIENTVQAADVYAAGDVIVRRGILTRSKTRVSADGSVYAKFIENSIVEADADIVVQNAILSSQVRANRNVIAISGDGAIIGGEILAFDKVIAKNIGSAANVKTYVQTGYRYDVQKQYLETTAKLRSIQKKLDEVKKGYDYASASGKDMDKLGELRGKAMKFLKLQKQMQEDLTEISNGRIFNQFSAVEALGKIHPGAQIFLGDTPFPIAREMSYAAIKWDIENKSVYFTSYDELTRGASAAQSKKAKTVLIIDDSKAVRRTLKLILEKMGMRVIAEAEDGVSGVAKFKETKPALVTCDIAMVNMNGLEALAQIRNINPKAKVIMISSMNDKRKVLDCIMSGAADFILKPFEPKRVMTVVRSVMEK